MEKHTLPLPTPRKLPGSEVVTEMVFVGDDAFPLVEHQIKPFCRRKLSSDERIFNYKLIRARRYSENAFGILASRFRLFLTEIDAPPDKVANCVAAACCLHNMLRRRCGHGYITPGSLDYENVNNKVIPTDWREIVHLDPWENNQQRNASNFTKKQRIVFRKYFNSSAVAVPWQSMNENAEQG